jgi:hypothetical protein
LPSTTSFSIEPLIRLSDEALAASPLPYDVYDLSRLSILTTTSVHGIFILVPIRGSPSPKFNPAIFA